ncbi:hypothetical protein [Clostridium sp. SM-530-WT-3G]|uniref:hypothetical protein n=1 Tax=Clostridium sp. SM-530-WT-3G TaxID=2725303 RepID=UPI00145C4134|nr:hypothetical protein [Clostridium sp. SM-530-WT-3G]NME81884.1 hypothetical protein [Clostridium sp. SM-530-WT-3G]
MQSNDIKILNKDELSKYISTDLYELLDALYHIGINNDKSFSGIVDKMKGKYRPNLSINLCGLSIYLNAYTYYIRYLYLINQLIREHKSKEIIDYYVFNNSLKELVGNGTSYYFNFRADMFKGTLFRITENLKKDNKKADELKEKIDLKVKLTEQSLIDYFGIAKDLAEYMSKNIIYNNEKDIVKMWILLCVSQVNGSKDNKLQSYSKSLGVVLFKYAHGKCKILIRENEDINCIKYKNENTTELQLFESDGKMWNNVEGFCIDFSNVRDDKLNNLNKWLESLYGEENNILTYSSPVFDRHVVNTFKMNENNSKIIKIVDNTELILFYRAYILRFKKQVVENVFDDCIKWLEYMKNECFIESSPDIIKVIEDMIKCISEIEKDPERSNIISEKISIVLNTVVDWEKECYYFEQFIKNKDKDTKMVEFLNNTENNMIVKLMKGIFYYLDRYEPENKEKSEG